MIDLNFIRENPDLVKQGVKSKGYEPQLVDRVLKIDDTRRQLIKEVERWRQARNQLKPGEVEKGKRIKEMLRRLEPDLKAVAEELKMVLAEIPNLPAEKVPRGASAKDNVEIKRWGKIPKFNFKPRDHLELGKQLGILDFEAGAKVAGSGFYFWLNEGALLELALTQYAFDLLIKEGFTPVITPDLARSRYYLGTGYLPQGPERQTYEIKDQDLGLIATAEVTLAGKHADETIPIEKLPLKYVGYSHCFRQEAGAYGKDAKGLYRVHQFSKIEMFVYCLPEESERWHEKVLAWEEKIYQGLEIPYRVVEMCTADLGAMASRKYDLEAWMPGRGDYGEVTSTSNCTDYQARNLNIKYRRQAETGFVHLINGTAIATARTALAILENYQQKDGSVLIPKVLQPYVGQEKITLR